MTDPIPSLTHKILKNSVETISDMENEITACNMKLAKCLAFIQKITTGEVGYMTPIVEDAERLLKEIGKL